MSEGVNGGEREGNGRLRQNFGKIRIPAWRMFAAFPFRARYSGRAGAGADVSGKPASSLNRRKNTEPHVHFPGLLFQYSL
ncbi:hypothetical protein HMPREF3039_00171 [Akkermansia sp. KLE1798]|nr:hypothetical protein HMPREF3039_00171 [Akkermansia sp. KLE1798]